MPVARFNNRRRRSSLAHLHLNKVKVRVNPSPKNVTFAPNVTPTNYHDSSELSIDDSVQARLFPPSELPAPPSKKRQPKGRRRSQGHIPRPPNAFMLFRADFVRQKHVPGSIEPNHTTLSKIIGSTWKSLPEEEKQVWVNLAARATAEHKAKYPNYKYQPQHRPKKRKVQKPASDIDPESEQRCEAVRQLLLEGIKGDDLAAALRDLDHSRSDSSTPADSMHPPSTNAPTPAPSLPATSDTLSPFTAGQVSLAPAPIYLRRPSSVPLPGVFPFPTALPQLPFPRLPSIDFGGGNPAAGLHLPRRPSSAQAAMLRTWAAPFDMPLPYHQHRPCSPLPEVNSGIFDPAYMNGGAFAQGHDLFPQGEVSFTFDGFASALPSGSTGEPIAPHEITISPLDPMPQNAQWLESVPGSTYSGSPAQSDLSLPLYAPKPQHAYDGWTTDKQTTTVTTQEPRIHNTGTEMHTLEQIGLHAGMDGMASFVDNTYSFNTTMAAEGAYTPSDGTIYAAPDAIYASHDTSSYSGVVDVSYSSDFTSQNGLSMRPATGMDPVFEGVMHAY